MSTLLSSPHQQQEEEEQEKWRQDQKVSQYFTDIILLITVNNILF